MAESDDAGKYLGSMMDISKFSGEDLTYTASKWAQDIEQNAEIFKWKPEQQLIIARRSLCGTAELWLRTEKVFKTYEELKTALLREFPDSVDSKRMHETMTNRKKREDETYYQYMLTMKELGKRAKFPDYVAIQYIIDGISDYESNKLLFYGVTTYPVLNERFILYEDFKKKSKKQDSEVKMPDEMRPTVQTYIPEREAQRCYKCGERGHNTASVCPRGLRCFQCNSFGHIGADCKVTQQHEPRTREGRAMFIHSEDGEVDETCEIEGAI